MSFIHTSDVLGERHQFDTEIKTPRAANIHPEALAAALEERVRGEVRFDEGYRALYATDASNYRQVPIGIVYPRDADDVVAAVACCRKFGAPVLARGDGTSLAGQSCNVAVVLDMTKHMNQVLEIDPQRQIARVQPGLILDDLREAAGEHGLTFGPDPATHSHCVLGGMIGNNACGVHALAWGKTVDNVEEMEILTYDGLRTRVGPTRDAELEEILDEGGPRADIYRRMIDLRERYRNAILENYPDLPRRVSGYNLPQLLPENGFNVARALVGSEGTLAIVLEATVRLVRQPVDRSLLVLGYGDVYRAADDVPELLAFDPIGLEGLDSRLVRYIRRKEMHDIDVGLLPSGEGWLLVEFGGESEKAADNKAREVMETLEQREEPPHMQLYEKQEEIDRIWLIRESGLGATANVPGLDDAWPGWEDAAVDPAVLGDYLRDLRGLLDSYHYYCSFYGHFGDGCVHVRIDFDLRSRDGVNKYLAFLEEAADLVKGYGGSFSGEHGDGQARAILLEKMFGREVMEAHRDFKRLWDPQNRMNPGKVISAEGDPYRPDDNLRLGTDYAPWQPETHFKFPDDDGSFARATLRCVGVGKCRRESGGTMCPSYMVTRDEKHTTRGRAHLLFEMLQGDVVDGGWQDEDVKESLELCLSCKGCKGDCPVQVDIATYKAEFTSHYYQGRLRPRQAYLFGLIQYWARLAARMPRVANFFTQTPGFNHLAKWLGNIAPERELPRFANETFTHWYRRRGPRNAGKRQLLLWPDTFNNHFYPETLKAGVEVLEDADYQVVVPDVWLCCGRPLYEFGFLNLAKRQLQQILETLRPQIRAGLPLVGLEPSCTAVFRDELCGLFPHDQDAHRLAKQTHTLAEFLTKIPDGYEPPRLSRKAIVHGHCHHKAIMRMESEGEILQKMGLDQRQLDSGCCGMAGAFGFERGEKYEVSVAAGERVLLPETREADSDTLILTNGFSCREQIRQETDRRALHLAEVMQMALRERQPERAERPDYPEQDREEETPPPDWRRLTAVASAGLLALLWLLERLLRRREKENE
ncbi:MAG: FAD-linked oxidase C-terminal domain-containing protein [Candidatus Promineifilaceae bacterium]|nr:FAD-linked oxidase C-terminal domain-containing protein [Candidatus Promineifilaceae bacterium]